VFGPDGPEYAAAVMRFLLAVALVVILLVGAFKLAGLRLPILDYPLGGPMTQPVIHVNQDPDLFP